MSLVFTNTASIGSQMPVSDSTPVDPYLELSVHAGASRRDIVKRVLARAVLSKHREEGLGQVFQFRTLEVVTKPKGRVYADNAQPGLTPAPLPPPLTAWSAVVRPSAPRPGRRPPTAGVAAAAPPRRPRAHSQPDHGLQLPEWARRLLHLAQLHACLFAGAETRSACPSDSLDISRCPDRADLPRTGLGGCPLAERCARGRSARYRLVGVRALAPGALAAVTDLQMVQPRFLKSQALNVPIPIPITPPTAASLGK